MLPDFLLMKTIQEAETRQCVYSFSLNVAAHLLHPTTITENLSAFFPPGH